MDMTLPREFQRVFSAAEEQPIDWLGEKRFSQFDVEFDGGQQILWARMRGSPVPNLILKYLSQVGHSRPV